MNVIRRALRPVKGRIRLMRMWKGFAVGMLCAGTACLGVMIASFLVPIREKLYLCGAALIALPVLLATVQLLRPVRDALAAQTADHHGLKERAQTALAMSGDEAITQLQREDTLSALARFDCRTIPFPRMRRIFALAAGITALAAVLFLLPNPQNAAINRAIAFEKMMEESARRAEEEADKASGELSEKDRMELHRLMTDLSRELRRSENEMDALLAISKAEERLEALRSSMAGEALEQILAALNAQGLNALAEALESGDALALEESLESIDAESLKAAAEQLSGEAQDLMNTAALALSSGNPQGAMSALTQLQSAAQSGAASQLGSASRTLSALRASAGNSDQGQGGQGSQGQSGQNTQGGQGQGGQNGQGNQAGSGAGQGTTNQEQSSAGSQGGSNRGANDPHYRETAYERIYDPTRLNTSQTDLSAQSDTGEGESMQVQLGPGAGTMGGSVPYDQVVYEYAEAAAQAADNQNLTAQERGWVNAYFASLTDEQN